MPPIPPTQCQPISSNTYTAYGVSFQVFAAGFVPDDVSQTLLHSEVHAAVQQFSESSEIVQHLISKGVIDATADEDEVSKLVAATMLLSSIRTVANGWSCCLHSDGMWFPYHPKYGWDTSQRCAQ